MKQIIVDITILTDEYMKANDLYCRYRVKAYVYDTNQIIEYGVREEYIQDYYIGKIIKRS